MFISLLYHIPSKIEKKTKNCKEFNAWFYYHLLCFFSIQIKEEVFLETSRRWVRTSANFYEVPWLSFGPKVPKLPSARNKIVSSTFLTAESFNICWMILKVDLIFFSIRRTICLHSKRLSVAQPFIFEISLLVSWLWFFLLLVWPAESFGRCRWQSRAFHQLVYWVS